MYGELPVPTREGYIFDGWYTSKNGGEKINSYSVYAREDDSTCWAHWTPSPLKTYTVIFNPNGGYVTPSSINVTEKESYGLLPTPIRDGYTFDGWYTSVTGGSMITSWSTVNISGSQTLYAHWEKEEPKIFNVTLDPNGGISEVAMKVVTNGETYKAFPIPTRMGYTFKGWFTSQSDGIQITADTLVNLTDPQILYAHWEKLISLFEDVSTTAYFYDPVMWAVENGVTNGTTATTFSPHLTCTTAHIITFLWRANGSPEPTVSKSFSDVQSSDYFAKAAVWAYEKGLVSGDDFNAGTPCTRAKTVFYLWKLAGKPHVDGDAFSDVPSNSEYVRAVTWAVNQGITNGTTETTFSPERICTRAHVVTFLWRSMTQ